MTAAKPKRAPDDEARCTAVNRSGERCQQWRVKPTTKCRFHGSGGDRTNRGRPIIHGRYSMRLKSIVNQQQADRLTELEDDPRLLDMGRTVAVSQHILEEYLPALTDEAVEQLWKRKNPPPPFWDPETMGEWGPSAGELLETKAGLVAQCMKSVSLHGNLQAQARRTLATEQLMAMAVLPVLTRLGADFMSVVADIVTPEQLERIRVAVTAKSNRAIIDVKAVITDNGGS